jgi:small subunit ribosomal protein S17
VRISGPKTAVVEINRLKIHPVYKKKYYRTKRFLVHDEVNCKQSDQVYISETRPKSARKSWEVAKKVK